LDMKSSIFWDITGLHGGISHKIELLITTKVRILSLTELLIMQRTEMA
jgi:hypothetical protein